MFRDERPPLSVLPPSVNVVPFRSSAPAEPSPALTPVERKAFSELANRLTARLRSRDKNESQEPAEPPPAIPSTCDAAAGGTGRGSVAAQAGAQETGRRLKSPPSISARSSIVCRSACWSTGSTS